MAYLDGTKVGDDFFGLVFGHGTAVQVDKGGFYPVIVEFDNGDQIPYTEDGIPAWGNFNYQTLFRKEDIDLEKLDFSTVDELPTPKKISKWNSKGKLEIKCPSGLWADASKWESYADKLLSEEKFWMFRKKN